MSVEERKVAARLAIEELARFARWFEELPADERDRRIEADLLAGRLDAAGRRTPLPP